MCGCLSHSPYWPESQTWALTRNQTGDPLVCRLAPNPLSHASQAQLNFFMLLVTFLLVIFICIFYFLFFFHVKWAKGSTHSRSAGMSTVSCQSKDAIVPDYLCAGFSWSLRHSPCPGLSWTPWIIGWNQSLSHQFISGLDYYIQT